MCRIVITSFVLLAMLQGVVAREQATASTLWERLQVPRTIQANGIRQLFAGGGHRKDCTWAFFAEKEGLLARLSKLDEDLWTALRDARCAKTMVLRTDGNVDIFELVGEIDKSIRNYPGPNTSKQGTDVGAVQLRRALLAGLQAKGLAAYKGTKIAVASPGPTGACKVSVSGKTQGVIEEEGFMRRCVEAFAGPSDRRAWNVHDGVEEELLSLAIQDAKESLQ